MNKIRVFIKLGCHAKGLDFLQLKSSMTCTYGGSHSIKIKMKTPTKKMVSHFNEGDYIQCISEGIFNANKNIAECFKDISMNRMPKNIRKEDQFKHFFPDMPTDVGKISIEFFPQNFEDYINSIRIKLYDSIKKTVKVSRWRCGQPGLHNEFSRSGMQFSFDNKKWFSVPHGIKIAFGLRVPPIIPKNIVLKVKKLVKNHEDQPKGHQLMAEAVSIRSTNSRNALLVAMSALEVAVKECIIKLNPNSKWVVENMPSPPLLALINDYILKLSPSASKNNILPLPPEISKIIKKAVTLRNQVAHSGVQSPKHETLSEIFETINDLLWTLDYCAGYEWAYEFISPKTKDVFLKK